MKAEDKQKIKDFLRQSNYIEDERSEEAMEDACRAWRYAYKNKDEVLLPNYILKIHNMLMRRLRPDIAGKVRTCDVWIGGKHKKFIHETIIDLDLARICVDMLPKILGNVLDKENYCKKIHVKFEDIHPFEDGNGRTGRIMWQIHRISNDLPIEIIHEGKEQMEYYKWFR